MAVNSDVAARLVASFAPLFGLWLLVGLVIAVLYHLNLFFLEGEFRTRGVQLLDVFVSALRGFAFVVAWPFIFMFDRTALSRIKVFLLSLSRKQRETNQDVKDAINEGRYWEWVRRSFIEQDRVERQRSHELETGEEQKRRLKVIHEGNLELDRIWMLTGAGSHPAGVRQLVRMYPHYYIAEEIAAGAKQEIELRVPWTCLRCGATVPAREIELPELIFLRILDWETDKMLVEGWALEGDFRMQFSACPKCGTGQPDISEPVSRLGKASDVVRLVREGLSMHWDLP